MTVSVSLKKFSGIFVSNAKLVIFVAGQMHQGVVLEVEEDYFLFQLDNTTKEKLRIRTKAVDWVKSS
jgi:hypothetical protein